MIQFGKVLRDLNDPLEFNLPQDVIFMWREAFQVEAIFVKEKKDVPTHWLHSQDPLKIFGSYSLIKRLLTKLDLPSGSKVIDVDEGTEIYFSMNEKVVRYSGQRKKRVVIVDDSPTIRKLLSHLIKQIPHWEIVAEIEKPQDITEVIQEFWPDLITLDLHLGEINGVEALKQFIAPKKIPTILITSQAIKDGTLVMDALGAGAVDYIQKPEAGNWEMMREELELKLDGALKSKWQTTGVKLQSRINKSNLNYDVNKFIIVIGSSTGGTQALQEIFVRLPENIPPILVTQHIPPGFSKALADRLNTMCPFEVKEAESGDEIRAGRILIAPGGFHLGLDSSRKKVKIFDAPPVNRFRPSVDFMFGQFKMYRERQIIAVMLTGMGKDGSLSMLDLKKQGAFTLAQDEASSVVFGMPKEAIKIGAIDHIVTLYEIADKITSLLVKNS